MAYVGHVCYRKQFSPFIKPAGWSLLNSLNDEGWSLMAEMARLDLDRLEQILFSGDMLSYLTGFAADAFYLQKSLDDLPSIHKAYGVYRRGESMNYLKKA
jgi:hypothetical protein